MKVSSLVCDLYRYLSSNFCALFGTISGEHWKLCGFTLCKTGIKVYVGYGGELN